MDQNEMYEMQAGMEDSSERLEKKEQLRAKVQALVSYYEDEKRRNEELTMELERLKAEQQQMQGMSGPIGPIGGPAPGMNGNGMSPPAGGMSPGGFAPAVGVPFAQRPQQANPYAPAPQGAFLPQQPSFPGGPGMGTPGPGMGTPAPAPDFPPQPPQGPGGYTLQSFGAPQAPQVMGMPPQGMPPQRPAMPPQPQNPYGAPPIPPHGMGMPPYGQQPGGFPPQPPAQQPFGQQPFGQPGFGAPMYPPQAPAYQNQGFGLTENIGTVLQTITQVRAKLQQFGSMGGYGYPQQPTYVDYDTVALLDKLYDQLGDLSRDLMQRR